MPAKPLTPEQKQDADRLMALCKAKGITQEALAYNLGFKTQSAVNQYLNGKIPLNIEAAINFAKQLNCTVADFSPSIQKQIDKIATSASDEPSNVREGPEIRGLVPLISSVQAGNWTEIVDTFQPGDAERWLPCVAKHGPSTFCLVVEGESMQNHGRKPSYDPGDFIFVDPDVSEKPGDCVVVRLDNREKSTFKQYQEEDGVKRLKALNPEWVPRYIDLTEEASICGVVIGKWVDS